MVSVPNQGRSLPEPTQFNMHDAKTNLSRLVERVEAGEEIVIARNGRPVAMLVPAPAASRAGIEGAWAGRVEIAGDFDKLPDDVARAFGIPD
jgi:prevent-host-death family protein